MVSHAEVVDRASHRAPSVSSRSRSRHQHHRGRSHQGGSSHHPQNEFPFFSQTGDVEIIIAADGMEKRYLLHKLILAQCSGFFEVGTSEEWSRTQALSELPSQPSRDDRALAVIGEESEVTPMPPMVTPGQIPRPPPGRRRWRYELDWDNVAEDEEPMLVQKTPSPGGLFTSDFAPLPPLQRPKPAPTQHSSFFRSVANLTLGSHHTYSQSTANLASTLVPTDPSLSSPIIRDYDNLFRIFYNHPPTLNATNIASAYSECKALLLLADMYDALPVIGSRVDHHLLRFSSRLFKQIAKYPPSYLKLGYLAHSRIIFSEALTHVVGQWPQPYPYLKEQGYEVADSVLDLIEDKVDELEELKAKVEAKLFRLTLTTNRGERVNPSNDYLGWLAMSLFRQWLAENTTPPPAGILKNGPNQPQQPQQRPPAAPAAATAQTGPGSQQPTTPSSSQPSAPPIHPALTSGRIYRTIGSTNPDAYLPASELKRFLKISSDPLHLHSRSSTSHGSLYSKENLRRFERKMDEVKNLARDLVRPLTRVCLEGDFRDSSSAGSGDGGGVGGLGYLVCMKVEEGELPWE